MASRAGRVWVYLGLCLLIFGVYGKALNYGFVAYDDPAFIVNNPYVQKGLSIEGLAFATIYAQTGAPIHPGVMNLWHPLTWLSWMVDSQVGIGAAVFHLTNILLHCASACLLVALLRRLGASLIWAGFAAALWAVHPLVVEPVAWVSARKDVLSTALVLACLVTYLKGKPPHSLWRYVSLACLAGAIAAKPNAVVVPAILVGLDLFFIAEKRAIVLNDLWTSLKSKVLFIVLSILGVVATLTLQYGGTHADFVSSFPLAKRVMLIPAQVGYYTARTIWPTDLSIDYPFPLGKALSLYSLLGGAVISAAALTLVRWFRKKGGGALGLTSLWLLVTYLPVSGIAYVSTSFTTDRYAYLPLIGAAASLALVLTKRLADPIWPKIAAVGIITTFAVLSFHQVSVWKTSESLFTAAAQNQPRSALVQGNYGAVHLQKGRIRDAEVAFLRALELNPQDYIVRKNLSDVYRQQGRNQDARDQLLLAVEAFPGYGAGWFALAELEYSLRENRDAVNSALKAAHLLPYQRTEALWLALAASQRSEYLPEMQEIAAQVLKQKDLSADRRALAEQVLKQN